MALSGQQPATKNGAAGTTTSIQKCWTVLCFALLSSCIVQVQASSVHKLTVENYDELTAGNISMFVRFYTPWCAECKEMSPAWEKLAAEWKDHEVGVVAEVDCDDDDGSPVCEAFEVTEYPAFYYGDPSSPELYKGDLDYESLAKFAKEHISNPSCSVSNMDYCDEKTKSTIDKLRKVSREDLETMEADVVEKVEKEETEFDKEAAKIRQQYEDLVTALNSKVDEIREKSNFKWVQQMLNKLDEHGTQDTTKKEL